MVMILVVNFFEEEGFRQHLNVDSSMESKFEWSIDGKIVTNGGREMKWVKALRPKDVQLSRWWVIRVADVLTAADRRAKTVDWSLASWR